MDACSCCEGHDSLCAKREEYADEGRCYDREEFGWCSGCVACDNDADDGLVIYCECGLYIPFSHLVYHHKTCSANRTVPGG